MLRLKPHPRQTVAAVVKVCHLWLGWSGVEKCRVDHKIGSKTFTTRPELLGINFSKLKGLVPGFIGFRAKGFWGLGSY